MLQTTDFIEADTANLSPTHCIASARKRNSVCCLFEHSQARAAFCITLPAMIPLLPGIQPPKIGPANGIRWVSPGSLVPCPVPDQAQAIFSDQAHFYIKPVCHLRSPSVLIRHHHHSAAQGLLQNHGLLDCPNSLLVSLRHAAMADCSATQGSFQPQLSCHPV